MQNEDNVTQTDYKETQKVFTEMQNDYEVTQSGDKMMQTC